MKNVAPARTLVNLTPTQILFLLGSNYRLQLKTLSRTSKVNWEDIIQTYFLIYFECIDGYDPAIGPLKNFLWSKLRIKILDMTYGVNRFPLQLDLTDHLERNIVEDIPVPLKHQLDEGVLPDFDKYPSLKKPWDFHQKYHEKSINDIAMELGVTKRCVYQQFKKMREVALKAHGLI